MASKFGAMILLACAAAVLLPPSAFVPGLLSPSRHGAPRAARADTRELEMPQQDAPGRATESFGVVAAAVAVGLLVGVMGAPMGAQAVPTGIVEHNELWRSHDLKKHNVIDFQARMEIAAKKDYADIDAILESQKLLKEARDNAQELKLQRVARAKEQYARDHWMGEPAVADKMTPVQPKFNVPNFWGGKVSIPGDFADEWPADIDN